MRLTLGRGGPGQEAWEHGRAWPDSLGVCGNGSVGWGARVGGGHGPLPAAAGPLGLPAQPRALAGTAARRPLGFLRPPRREPSLSPAAWPLSGSTQRLARRR